MESFVLDCARSLCACAYKTCFHCFGSNSVNFYRIKLNFNVFWEPLKNLKLWLHFCYSAMASFAVAGVFTYSRIIFVISPCIKEFIFIGFEYLKVFLACQGPIQALMRFQVTMNTIYNITYFIFFSEIQLNSLMDFLLYIFTLFNIFDRETCQVKTHWTSQDTQT